MSVISQFIETFNRWVSRSEPIQANSGVLTSSHLWLKDGALKRSIVKTVFTGLFVLPVSAIAAVDWLAQVSDTGYDPVAAGANVVYDVRVANNGNSAAPATTVDLAVSANTTYLSATGLSCAPAGPIVGPATITCTVPALAAAGSAGDNVLVQVTVRTSVAGVVSLGASLPTAGDSDTANNAPPAENTTVNAGADVALAVTGPASAQSGSTVTYVYTLTNNGPDSTTGSVLTIPKPTGLDNIVTPSGCSLAGSTYTCNLAAIAFGANRTVNLVGQLSVASGSTVTPQGSVVASGGTLDPVAINNTDTTSTTVTAGSDLIIAKSSAPSGGSVLVGSAVTFTLAPRYTGDNPGAMTITDTIPSNYTIGTVTSPQNGWTCGVAGQVVTCNKANGTVAGLNVALGNIVIPTTASLAGAGVVNTASITGPVGQDPNSGNNSASSPAMTLNNPTVDLRANKTGPSNPALVVVGSAYTFDISMTNIGTSVFFGTARMVDNLPAGLTVNSYTLNGWTCLPAAPVVGPAAITCERTYTSGASLGVNTTTPIVTLNTTATGTGSIVNSLTVSSPDANIADSNATNDTVTYAVDGANGAASADISIVKTISNPGLAPYTVVAGDELEYKLEIINSGSVTSNNVTVSDALQALMNSNEGPTGAGFIDAIIDENSATGGNCSSVANGGNGRNLTCTFTTIPTCSNGTTCPIIYVRVRPGGDATTTRTNTASAVSSVTHDPNLGNNTDTSDVSTITAKVDVTVTKTASAASVPAGQNLTYVITARNTANGLSSAENMTITDTLPSNLVFISASPSTGTCATQPAANSTTGAGNNQLQCNLGTVVNGGQQTVTVVVRPRTETNGTAIVNNVDVTTTTPEDNVANNHADVSVNVTAPAFDLLVNKTVSIDPIAAGDDTVYTVTVQNQGPSAAQGIVITDNLPTTRLSYQSNTVPVGGTCPTVPAANAVGGTIICNLAYLAPGATTSFTVTMRGVVKGVDNNTAHVTDSADIAFDTVSGNNTRTIPTTVRTKADLEVVSKTVSANPVNLNQPFNYVIRVTNNGPSEGDDVVVSDNLPAGMQLTGAPTAVVISGTTVPAVPAACTGVAGGTALTCNLGSVNLNAVVDITVPVRVVSNGGVFNNTASVLTSSLDTNGGSNPLAGNNFKTTPVTVNKSSLAGIVYRDVNDDGAQLGAGETGIAGVQMRLTGTDFYGNAITRTATTAADGSYLFDNLPQSDAAGYTVIEIAQPATFSDGKETAGSQAGTLGADHTTDIISAIVLPANTAATGYLFGEIPPVIVSGTVFNDTNGLLGDNFVNGTGTNAASGTLTAYLVQAGNVVSKGTVAADGTFSLAAVANTTGYTVVLSNNAAVAIGAPAPARSLPAGWVNTGEVNGTTATAHTETGTDIANGVSTTFDVALVTVPNRNFGIEQPPVPGVVLYVNQPNPGATATVPVDSGAFTGTLPPVGTSVGNVQAGSTNATDTAAVTSIRITAFPTNTTTITINGTTYTSGTFPGAGVNLTPAQLSGMTLDPIDGVVNAVIPYTAFDAAGFESTAGSVTLPFGNPGKIDVVKAAGVPNQVGAKTFEVDYSVVVANLGGPTVFNAQADDNLKLTYPTANTITVSNYAVANGTGGATCSAATPSFAGTAAVSALLSGSNDLAAGQSCVITFRVTVDFGTNPIPTVTQNNTVYASGVGSDSTPNPGYTVPDVGSPTPPAVASTVDISVTAAATVGAPGTPPPTPTPVAGAPAGVPTPVLLQPQYVLSGNVFDDFNGTKIQDNPAESAASKPIPAGINAVLRDAAGVVIAVNALDAAGNFNFAVSPNTNYGVVITTANPAIGATSVTVSLPAGWVTTGENLNGVVEAPDVPNSQQSVTTPLGNLTNVNFGIEQLPDTTDVSLPSQPNPGGTLQVQVPTLIGTDPEDGAKGAGSTFVISTLPDPATMGTLYYNGVPVVAGQTIVNYDPALLTLDPVDGAITAIFTVASVDAAGKVDPTPATVTMPFGQLTLSGNVFNDINASRVKDLAAENALSLGLNAVLTDTTGRVIAVTRILADGTYSFPVSPNTSYGVTVTTANPAVGATTVPVALPSGGWQTTGESLGTVAEGTPDSKQTVSIVGASVVNVNFGLTRPTASISGNVWQDTDHNRQLNGERAVAGITVELVNLTGTVVKSTQTDANGHYAMTELTPGDYTVRFRDNVSGGLIIGTPTYNDALANTVVGDFINNTNGTKSKIETISELNVTLVAGLDLPNQSLPLDPGGVVYNSVTRAAVAGATVTIMNADGVTPVPNACLQPSTPNAQVTGGLGIYQFLLINPAPGGCQNGGVYVLRVTQPSGYLPPDSTIIPPTAGPHTPAVATGVEAIQPQAEPPTGSMVTIYYTSFNLALGGAGVVNNHIPLDPILINAFIVTKTGNKTMAEIGDVVTYTVQARLTQGVTVTQIQLIDNLPAGFRYIPGTSVYSTGTGAAIKMGAGSEPSNVGPQLTFNVGPFPASTLITVVYKVRVGVGAMQGDGINRVQGRSGPLVSNTAQFKVKVTGGVFTNDACVAGKVFVDCNNNHIQDAEEIGIPGVRMYMEDGTYFISDVEGKYSYCGISPKTHVLKVDSLTMPRGSRLTTTSNRNAGDGNSLFLDTKNGELIRADFAEGSCSNTVLEQVKARRTGGEVRAPETEKKGGPAIKFEGKSPAYPQQGTDSANQRLVKPRGGAGTAPVSATENDEPVQPLPESSGNTRGNNLRDQKGEAK